jgi:hypothetical protein
MEGVCTLSGSRGPGQASAGGRTARRIAATISTNTRVTRASRSAIRSLCSAKRQVSKRARIAGSFGRFPVLVEHPVERRPVAEPAVPGLGRHAPERDLAVEHEHARRSRLRVHPSDRPGLDGLEARSREEVEEPLSPSRPTGDRSSSASNCDVHF